MASKRQKATGAGAGLVALAIAIAAPIVMDFEGKRNVTYLDPILIPTVCFGHTGSGVEKGRRYTDEECRAMLHGDMRRHADGIAMCLTREMPPEALAASVSLAFNIGVRAFCRSTIARKFNAGDVRGACNGFPAWKRAGGRVLPGLVRRRAAEQALCLQALA